MKRFVSQAILRTFNGSHPKPTFPIWALSGYTAGFRGHEYIMLPQESKPLCVRNRLNAAPSGVKTTVSEINQLELRDLKLTSERPHIHVRKGVGKGGKARKVPLWWDAGTLAFLQQQRGRLGYCFNGQTARAFNVVVQIRQA